MTRFDVSPSRVMRLLLVVIAALLALHLIAVVAVALAGGPHGIAWWLLTYFSVDSEESLPTAYSIVMLAVVAIVAGQLALLSDTRSLRVGWGFIAVVFALLSWDEGAGFHEKIGWYLGEWGLSGPFAYGWLVVGIPAAVVLGLAMIALLRSLPRAVLGRMVLAGGIFVAGAVGMEVLAGMLVDAGVSGEAPAMLALTAVEEGLEMIGVAYFLVTLLRHRAILESRAGVRIVHRGRVPAAVVAPPAETNDATVIRDDRPTMASVS